MASASDEAWLVLISGAIASGKTSAVTNLASLARSRGIRASAIDMDDLVEIVAGDWPRVETWHRKLACTLAATMADCLLDQGMGLIAMAGSTLAPYEWELVQDGMTMQPRSLHVLLRVSLEESQRRAMADPGRMATSDPAVVKRHFERIDWSRSRKPDLDIDTDGLALDEVVALVAAQILV
jgi:adenylylsulfate kinase-like enzyme